MECGQCGSVNRSERRFCSGCGAALTAACPACGFANGLDEKFCGGCGKVLGAPALSPAPLLETERKYVTVLFADVRGSLEIIADRDPEEAKAVLDPVLECLVHSVKAFGGTVNRTIGDGIMALFGAPVAYEDHAFRAASASLAMLQAPSRQQAGLGDTVGMAGDLGFSDSPACKVNGFRETTQLCQG